jgi:hypothetical protein
MYCRLTFRRVTFFKGEYKSDGLTGVEYQMDLTARLVPGWTAFAGEFSPSAETYTVSRCAQPGRPKAVIAAEAGIPYHFNT